MNELILDGRQTIILAILVLFLGKFLNTKIGFLREFNIPELADEVTSTDDQKH